MQHPVDSIPDSQGVFERFHMDIGGPLLNRLEQNQIDQVDERGLFGHPVDVVSLDRIKVVFEFLGFRFGIACQGIGHLRCGGSVMHSHQIHEDGTFHSLATHRHAGQCGDLVGRIRIEWIQHCQDKPPLVDSERNDAKSDSFIGPEGIHGIGEGLDGPFVPRDIKQIASGTNACGIGTSGCHAVVAHQVLFRSRVLPIDARWGSVVLAIADSASDAGSIAELLR